MKTLSQDLLTRRESSPDKKTFWDTIRIESRESPSRYKKALQDILSMSPPSLRSEIISEIFLSKFNGVYSKKYKNLFLEN